MGGIGTLAKNAAWCLSLLCPVAFTEHAALYGDAESNSRPRSAENVMRTWSCSVLNAALHRAMPTMLDIPRLARKYTLPDRVRQSPATTKQEQSEMAVEGTKLAH